MYNIFKNAYFGKVYKTRDGRKAVYKNTFFRKSYATNSLFQFHRLMVDGGDEDGNDIIAFMNNGKRGTRCQDIDIVSEWQELIDEEKLSKFAWEHTETMDIPCRYEETAVESFKAGYRKAMENNYEKASIEY